MEIKRPKFICSKCGRDTDAPSGTERLKKQLCTDCYGKRDDKRQNQLNELSGSLWARYSKSVENYSIDVNTSTENERLINLLKQQIEIYSKSCETVLNPLMNSILINKVVHESNRQLIDISTIKELDLLPDDSINLILSCSDYFNLPKFIMCDSYRDTIINISNILAKCYKKLSEESYTVMVINDIILSGKYINFHGDLIKEAERNNFILWDIKIYDHSFSNNNDIGHTYIVILRKTKKFKRRSVDIKVDEVTFTIENNSVINRKTNPVHRLLVKSVEKYPDTRSDKQRLHGASYSMSFARQQIEAFSSENDIILDPFAGVGTTLDAAIELNRKSIGIEINEQFYKIESQEIQDKGKTGISKLILGDSNKVLDELVEDSINLVLTSPPYANLLKNIKGKFAYKWQEHSKLDPIENPRPYTDLPNDLGNMTYDESIAAMQNIMTKCYGLQKLGGYAIWVVKDFRYMDKKIPYINFHCDVIDIASRAGYTLWGIRIYDQTEFRPLVCLGYPSRNYYLNLGHSYILIFKK